MVSQNTKVITGCIRMNYTNLFTPKSLNDGDEPKYSVLVLIPKSEEKTVKEIQSAVEVAKQAGMKRWGGKLPDNLKLPLKDGDIEHPELEDYAAHYFLNASSRIKPGVVDRDRREIKDPSLIYSGCYGRVSMTILPYSQGGSQGICCSLLNVQKLSDGEPLYTRSTPEEDFADSPEEDILW